MRDLYVNSLGTSILNLVSQILFTYVILDLPFQSGVTVLIVDLI